VATAQTVHDQNRRITGLPAVGSILMQYNCVVIGDRNYMLLRLQDGQSAFADRHDRLQVPASHEAMGLKERRLK